MGAEGAANVIFRRELADAADPASRLAELVDEYRERLMHPYYAAERGWSTTSSSPPTPAACCAGPGDARPPSATSCP